MIPKASNQHGSKKELQVANKLSALCDPMSLDMDMVGFYLSVLPANQQLRFIDMLMAYVNTAKQSEHDAIRAWANSYCSTS